MNKIPKPKPKVEKPQKNDTTNDGDKTEKTDEKPSDDQPTKDSTSSSTEETSNQSNTHDEF